MSGQKYRFWDKFNEYGERAINAVRRELEEL